MDLNGMAILYFWHVKICFILITIFTLRSGRKILHLISPARFLFNAGSTSKKWNKKMLNDEHIKVVYYEQNSSKIFSNVGISGGIVILYRDKNIKFGAIQFFTSFKE